MDENRWTPILSWTADRIIAGIEAFLVCFVIALIYVLFAKADIWFFLSFTVRHPLFFLTIGILVSLFLTALFGGSATILGRRSLLSESILMVTANFLGSFQPSKFTQELIYNIYRLQMLIGLASLGFYIAMLPDGMSPIDFEHYNQSLPITIFQYSVLITSFGIIYFGMIKPSLPLLAERKEEYSPFADEEEEIKTQTAYSAPKEPDWTSPEWTKAQPTMEDFGLCLSACGYSRGEAENIVRSRSKEQTQTIIYNKLQERSLLLKGMTSEEVETLVKKVGLVNATLMTLGDYKPPQSLPPKSE